MNAPALLLMLAFAAQPVSAELPTERVDLIETNTLYDLNGVLLLRQGIFYDWDEFTERYQIAAWRMIKTDANLPRPCEGGYEMVFVEGGGHRRVFAPKFRESWTQSDPEILERKHLPSDQRRGIFQKRVDVKSDPLPPAPLP